LRKLITLLAALSALAIGCGDDDAPVATPAPVAPQPVAPGTTPTPAPGTPAAAPAGASNFGTVTLSTGFTPDPHTATGTSGGAVNAQNLNQACRGWIAQNPDHLFVAQTAFSNLRILVNGGSGDTTLVVQKPDGSYVCNDDAEGRNPIVTGSFTPGTYKVWVGSYEQNQNTQYTIGFTELGSVTVASLGGGGGAAPAGNGESNFGTVTLASGFMPDPHKVTGTSGGNVQASTLNPSCTGWVTTTPDHLFVASDAFSNLRILVNSANDTTLVVRKPDGTYVCNDDAEGHNPIVTGSFPAGTYQVHIGSYNQNDNSPYTLGFTELSSVTAASLAQ